MLEPNSWKRVEQGVWRRSDAIHNLEARALTKAWDRSGNVASVPESKVLLLGNSLAMTLVFPGGGPNISSCFDNSVAFVRSVLLAV